MSAEQDRIDVLEDDVQQLREALTEVLETLAGSSSTRADPGDSSESVSSTTRPDGEGGTGGAGENDAPRLSWGATADVEAWERLLDWVDWLILTYETALIRPCWPAHRGVVEELAAMFGAWRQAVNKTDTAGGDDDSMAFWHDRVLVPTLQRVASGFYPLRLCKDEHRDSEPAPSTNRDFTPVGVAVAAQEDLSA